MYDMSQLIRLRCNSRVKYIILMIIYVNTFIIKQTCIFNIYTR